MISRTTCSVSTAASRNGKIETHYTSNIRGQQILLVHNITVVLTPKFHVEQKHCYKNIFFINFVIFCSVRF